MRKDISLSARSENFNVYMSTPEGSSDSPAQAQLPGIILLEEIWGVTDHIKNVADRFAAEGFNVIAPELLSSTGILEKVSPKAYAEMRDTEHPEIQHAAQAALREAMQPLSTPEFAIETEAKLRASFEHVLSLPNSKGSVGMIGFCFGGTWSYFFATKEPRLKACIPFYGQPPRAEDIPAISCPVLAFYGEKDEGLMKTLPDLENAMLEAGRDFSSKVYPDTGHAFFNDTNTIAYSEAAAKDAWALSLEFLRENL
jgi:carboxymethylenebutenolidase